MNKEQFDKMHEKANRRDLLNIQDLEDRTPRTLVYGYHVDRSSFHVYIGQDGQIHVMTFGARANYAKGDMFLIAHHSAGPCGGVEKNEDFVPSKRVYPESCDYEFCRLLVEHGINLPFTTFTEGANEKRVAERSGYAGLTHYDGGMQGVNLHARLQEFFPPSQGPVRYEVTARLALQVARELNLPVLTNDYTSSHLTLVPENYVTEILALSKLYIEEADEKLSRSMEELVDQLENSVFEHAYLAPKGRGFTSGGEVFVEVDNVPAAVQFAAQRLKKHKVTGQPDLVGVSGQLNCRPFFAVRRGTSVSIHFSQFGDTKDFLSKAMRLFGFEPFKTAEAVSTD